MNSTWDALPVIVPFFGVLAFTVCGGFTVMTRRLNTLTQRIETVERNNLIQQTARPLPPAQAVWTPPQSQWPAYPAYPYPSAPSIMNTTTTTYPQQELR
jgi:hypothetical protein